jgi:predicted DCC family thiol-disulfide oxidoreductase YuxK
MKEQPIILFDDECGFCRQTMLFVKKRQGTNSFNFISFLSSEGKQVADKYNIENNDTVILIEKGILYSHSTAILRICAQLVFPWSLLKILLVIPALVRDRVYLIISRNRNKLFKGKEVCKNT